MVGMVEVGAPISLDGVAVHPDCWCICLRYLHFATENPEDGKMCVSVPAHPRCPDKVQRAVKWLCMCGRACVHACVYAYHCAQLLYITQPRTILIIYPPNLQTNIIAVMQTSGDEKVGSITMKTTKDSKDQIPSLAVEVFQISQ